MMKNLVSVLGILTVGMSCFAHKKDPDYLKARRDGGDLRMILSAVDDDGNAVSNATVHVLMGMPPAFLFNPTWNAAKIVRRGQINPNPNVVCLVNNDPIVIYSGLHTSGRRASVPSAMDISSTGRWRAITSFHGRRAARPYRRTSRCYAAAATLSRATSSRFQARHGQVCD